MLTHVFAKMVSMMVALERLTFKPAICATTVAIHALLLLLIVQAVLILLPISEPLLLLVMRVLV